MNEQTVKVVEIRGENGHYYAGDLTLEIDSYENEPAIIHWVAFSGGSVKLKLDWEEVEALHAGLADLIAVKPTWA